MATGDRSADAGTDRAYYAAHQRIVRQAATSAQRAWTRLDITDLPDSWAEAEPQITETITQAQAEAAELTVPYIRATLTAAGTVSRPLGQLVAGALAGRATNGLPLSQLVEFAYSFYRRALALRAPPSDARTAGLARLLTYATTEVSDAARTALQIGSVLEPEIAGHERLVHLPACGRCVQLAGRLYRYSEGFLRHPRCDCTMKPVTREQWRTQNRSNNPKALFAAMTPEQQDKAFGKGGAAAIRAGADVSRVVNARRGKQVYLAGGREYTREATTARGVGHQLGGLTRQPGKRYRVAGVARPTPAQLVNTASGDDLVRQLARFGYIRH